MLEKGYPSEPAPAVTVLVKILSLRLGPVFSKYLLLHIHIQQFQPGYQPYDFDSSKKETHHLKGAISPLYHKAGTKRADGDLEAPGGYKCVVALFRMCMDFTCKLASSLVVKA
eukprot:1140799-Pelagomonas_calceolata.AAC.1